ncbi:MAG: thymidine phosphorylase [Polyangiales bacterium]
MASAPLRVPELIARKRDGGALEDSEIDALIDGFTRGEVPDYQMSAFAMAVCFQGMTFEETVALTLAMRDSGKVLRLGAMRAPIVDKHSTGGVGDKVTICLAPLVAACGAVMPTMSGRGLGHTGGTLDKLQSIPGFRVDLSVPELRGQLRRIGVALIGQTGDLAPADRRLYALRDVTGTIESVPLITASILSKKLAAGIDNLVLDVKVGRGAFMKTPAAAQELARSLVRVGRLAGKQVSAILTDMNAPLGYAVGNAIETAEAIEVLHGKGPEDLREVTFELGAEMLRCSKLARSKADARRQLRAAIREGTALAKMRQLIQAQGGDPRVADEPDRLEVARSRIVVRSSKAGHVREIDALEIGYAAMALGAGRTTTDEPVDPGAGIRLHVSRGDRVARGDALATLYSSKRTLLNPGVDRVLRSISLGKSRPRPRPRIIEAIRR